MKTFTLGLTVLVAFSMTSAKAEAPEDFIYAAKDWRAIYGAYKQFRHRDDGVIAGAFADRVATLLAWQWGDLDKLQELSGRNASFRRFVLRHLGEITPADDAKQIEMNANQLCPATAQPLCAEIVAALKR